VSLIVSLVLITLVVLPLPASAWNIPGHILSAAIAGMEQVTTPDGSFKAYKLTRSESWTVGSIRVRGDTTTTYFYSPETRSIIKSSNVSENNPGTVETELIKFTPGNYATLLSLEYSGITPERQWGLPDHCYRWIMFRVSALNGYSTEGKNGHTHYYYVSHRF